MVEWPTPTSRKQLQRFLGFTKFYRRIIRDYSQVAAPLTRLTSTAQPFAWTKEAEDAFARLKVLFTTAPVLTQILRASSPWRWTCLTPAPCSPSGVQGTRSCTPVPFSPEAMLLVAINGPRYQSIHCCLWCVRPWKVFTRAPHGSPEPAAEPTAALVLHRSGFRHWTAALILTIVDHFSKAAHVMPLPRLPSAVEIGGLLVQHVFRLHGIPRDIAQTKALNSPPGCGGLSSQLSVHQ